MVVFMRGCVYFSTGIQHMLNHHVWAVLHVTNADKVPTKMLCSDYGMRGQC